MTEKKRGFKQKSQLEHCKISPGMYIGSVKPDTIPMYVLEEDKFSMREIKFTTGLLKIFDEVLVNATDHYTNYPKLVKNIDVTFNVDTGEILVRNNGPGIPVDMVETLNDGTMYRPQAIFTQFLSGDNFDDEDEIKQERIVGGQNGLGSKISAAYSDLFQIETYDENTGILYKQGFIDRLNVIDTPIIKKVKDSGYTQVKFLPNYKAFGYKKYTKSIGEDILKLIEARVYHTAVFVGAGCQVSFQGKPIVFGNSKPVIQCYAEMYLQNTYGSYHTTLVHPTKKHLNIDVVIGISDGHFRNSSIINGISVYNGGTHIKWITGEITKNIMPKVEALVTGVKSGDKKIHPNIILNNLFIFVKCSVSNPLFDSQTKSTLTTPQSTFEVFKFKAKDWAPIWTLVQPHVMETLIGKLKDKPKTRVTRGKILLKKGDDAKFAGNKTHAKRCTLFIAEGDSAMGLIDDGINHDKTDLDRNYCGTYSIQGVPVNARKEVTSIPDIKNDTVIRLRTEKLQKNVRFENLVKLLGLDYEKKYEMGTTAGDKEMESLRYGRVVVATDADVDGKGQIFGLLINFFDLFWPDLIKRGYVSRFNTPIIRAFPRNTKDYVMEFYSINQFENWIQEKFGGDQELAGKRYNINYYKGLAGNDTFEIVPTFSNFEKKLTIYNHDTAAQDNLDVYFGKSTDDRKDVLAVPVSRDDIEACDRSNVVDISAFLKTDVKEFQRDNIIRKLPHVMDGMVPSRRKTLFGARLNKTMETTKVKVVNFTGNVMEKTGYTHGDASLSQTIIKMAQSYCGAKNMPFLIGLGRFGTRKKGGKDAGSPRYISIKINRDLSNAVFPREDDPLLPYTFDDGERTEPEYYCPIVPMAVLESMHIPATGWTIHLWARDFQSVMRNVRNMVSGETKKCKKLGIWMRGNHSSLRIASDGKEYMVGKYIYDKKKNTVTITELPISVFNVKYIRNVAYTKDNTYIKEIKNVEDYSNYDEVKNVDNINIVFELMPGAMTTIETKYAAALKSGRAINTVDKSVDTVVEAVGDIDLNADVDADVLESDIMAAMNYRVDPLFDAIEEFFKLRLCINSNLNVIDKTGEVLELRYYGSIVNIWFQERKRLYGERIERMKTVMELYIQYLENIIRFVRERDTMKITNKTTEAQFNSILGTNGYQKFNKSVLLNPGYNQTGDLDKLILGGDASYDYIINLTNKAMLKESNIKREAELKAKREELKTIMEDYNTNDGHFIGQKTWLRELDHLEPIVMRGIKNGWDTKKITPKFKD
jgi:DNA topoisomerase-2